MSQDPFVPFQSRGQSNWPLYPAPIPESWTRAARSKGFRVARRVRDRYHIVLECRKCGAETVHKAFTLRTAQPACGGCLLASQKKAAEAAGFTLLSRDAADFKYGNYRLPCGHERKLQFGYVDKIAREGPPPGCKGYHCPECRNERLAGLAAERGWAMAGADPEGDGNYRLFRHAEGCGHEQRVAVANMETGRFNCTACGEGWSSAPSEIYLVRLNVPGRGTFLKLGHSRDPDSRFAYQLGLSEDVQVEFLHRVPIATGHEAQKLEKALHCQIRSTLPEAVVPPDELDGWIRVTSEIYRPFAEAKLLHALDELEQASG